jgi:hypothetical protein
VFTKALDVFHHVRAWLSPNVLGMSMLTLGVSERFARPQNIAIMERALAIKQNVLCGQGMNLRFIVSAHLVHALLDDCHSWSQRRLSSIAVRKAPSLVMFDHFKGTLCSELIRGPEGIHE